MGTLNRDFSSIDHAQRTAEIAAEKYPDMRFEPELELSDISLIDLSNFGKEEIQDVNPWHNFNAT
jgi:hypothetical protein